MMKIQAWLNDLQCWRWWCWCLLNSRITLRTTRQMNHPVYAVMVAAMIMLSKSPDTSGSVNHICKCFCKWNQTISSIFFSTKVHILWSTGKCFLKKKFKQAEENLDCILEYIYNGLLPGGGPDIYITLRTLYTPACITFICINGDRSAS